MNWRLGETAHIIVVLYISPTGIRKVKAADFCTLLKHIRNECKNEKIHIFGDFNMANVDWQMDQLGAQQPATNSSASHERTIVQQIVKYRFEQVIREPNNNYKYLDLVLTTAPLSVMVRKADQYEQLDRQTNHYPAYIAEISFGSWNEEVEII